VTDYGHDLRFGTFLTPDAETPDRVVALAELTERLGLDLVTVQDHPYQARHLDMWTLLSVIAARTSRVTVAPNVANLPLRPPVVLARSVATLDRLTGGRVEPGLGAGRHLVDVHDHLRGELERLRDLVAHVTSGDLSPGDARSHIATMTVRQNNWTVGTYCASYCRLVTTHHTLEDVSVFPHLRDAEPGLAPVLDRLQEEHLVIQEVLDRVDRALVDVVTTPDGAEGLRDAMDLLTDTLLSHLSYEERELVEPLARHGLG
jgi:hypothetical protein